MKSTVLKLIIISADKKIFEGEVSLVTFPGAMGSFTILADHAPLVSVLNAGTVSYEVDGSVQQVEIKGGFVEVHQNLVTATVE